MYGTFYKILIMNFETKTKVRIFVFFNFLRLYNDENVVYIMNIIHIAKYLSIKSIDVAFEQNGYISNVQTNITVLNYFTYIIEFILIYNFCKSYFPFFLDA